MTEKKQTAERLDGAVGPADGEALIGGFGGFDNELVLEFVQLQFAP